jgi:hypothetical protein
MPAVSDDLMRFLSFMLCFLAVPALAQDIPARCAALGLAYNSALGLRDGGLTEVQVLRELGAAVPASEACHLSRVVRRALLSNDKMSRETQAAWVASCVARDPPLAPCS